MPQSDVVLLDKWRASNDADAFAELLSRHASTVYGACLRVIRNPGIAEEVAQECFLELMKAPRGVQCIGAWLHTVATRRALDRIKSEGRRSVREREYANTRDTTTEASWDDTREFVDEAIASLPNDLRIPIVLRFLEGRTHESIAEELAVSRSTVRSRIEKGIGVVRENLVKRGVVLSVATLSTSLETLSASAAPPALLSELGRRAIAMRSAPTLLSAAAGAKYAAAPLLVAGLVLAGAWTASRYTTPTESAAEIATPTHVVATALAPEPPDAPEVPAVVAESPEAAETPPAESAEEPAPSPAAEEEAEGWRLDLTPSEQLKLDLQKTVNIEFRDTHIKDVLEFLQDSLGINIVLDGRVVAPESEPGDVDTPRPSREYATDGMVRHIDQKGKTLEETLSILTSMVNLTYKVRGNAVWISSSSQITRDMTVPLPSAPFREGEILKSISAAVNIEFEDIHIADILGFFQKSFEISIVLDERVVVPEGKRGEEASPVLPTHVTDGFVDYVNLKDMPMAEALYTLTRLLDLTYRVDRDGVYISTPDRVREDF
jgi:RNA polymerase sigma factor (sigma-70 family)